MITEKDTARPLTRSERVMCTGPPTSYYERYELTISGYKFESTSNVPFLDAKQLRDAVVMHATASTSDKLCCGILRNIVLLKDVKVPVQTGYISDTELHDQPILFVDGLHSSEAGLDAHLKVPAIDGGSQGPTLMSNMAVPLKSPAAQLIHAQILCLSPGARSRVAVCCTNWEVPCVAQGPSCC